MTIRRQTDFKVRKDGRYIWFSIERKLDDELLYTVGLDVFVGAIGNSEVVKTMDESIATRL